MDAIYYEQLQVSAAFGMPRHSTGNEVSSVYWHAFIAMPHELLNVKLSLANA